LKRENQMTLKKAAATMKKTKMAQKAGKGGSSGSQRIEAKNKEMNDWRGEVLARVRKLIQQTDPDAVENVKGESRRTRR